VVDPTVALLANANAALSSGRLIEPSSDCALYWAQKLKLQGSPQGAAIEKSVLEIIGQRIDIARANRNYDSAMDDINLLMQFYPASNKLLSLKSGIENEQRQQLDERRRQLAEAKIRKFVVQHRHLLFDNAGNMVQAYCVGILAVAPDGNARFDCGTTFDPQGRCDHVAFLQGTIKDVKFLRNGLLHVATRGMGNYDFYAEGPDLQSAYQELGVLARK
jgi:hypothetical protein